MTELHGAPQPRPLAGAPDYFRRIFDTTGMPPIERCGDVEIHRFVGRLTIYGYASASTYPEDAPIERAALRDHGSFPTMSFSEVVPDGEYGFQPLGECEPITRAEFEAARARGWDA